MSFPIILLIGAMLCRISFMVVTVFHELGHAISGMHFSKGGATIYLGSYGDASCSAKFSVGKLKVYIRKNPFKWSGGMCVLNNNLFPVNKKIVELLAGSLTPFLFGSVFFFVALYFDMHGSVKLCSGIFLGVAIFSMFQSLVPSSTPVESFQGKFINNDGQQIKKLLKFRKVAPVLDLAVELYDQSQYEKAAELFDSQVLPFVREPEIFKLATLAYLHAKNFEKASKMSAEHLKVAAFDADDFSNAALACSHIEENDQALAYYHESLLLDPLHKYSLNNLGFTLNNMERYQDAIPYFDRAIALDPKFAYSYNNRGLAKLMLGDRQGGLADIDNSFKLDPENAYAYRNLGIYHLTQNEYEVALELFEKAKSSDPDTHKIDYFLEVARRQQTL